MFLSAGKHGQWFQCSTLWAGGGAEGVQSSGAPLTTSFPTLGRIPFQRSAQQPLGIMIFVMKSVSYFRDSVFSFAITFAKIL